ncbi:MOSC domain-containing protein [Litoreibacter sp.]|nr:MOSC domain-containing protein [Litoreibacter sp.]
MPALKKTDITGKIIWLGRVVDRAAALRSQPVQELNATFAGPEGEDHGGLTRASCSRVVSQYPKNTIIRNTRQFAIVSAEEMAEVARTLGVADFNPEWSGTNVVIEGIPDFTHIPPSSRLQTQRGTTLTIDMENRPCHLPAPVIDEDAPGFGRRFKAAAKGKRGVTAWMEREGILRVGDVVTLHIPDQRAWSANG